jgi:hypothetical protein
MNSKEVLERIKDDIEIGYLSTKHDNVKDKDNYLVMLKIIKQDLEMLEILKKHLYVHQTNAKDLFELRAMFDLETYDEEERQENQKIKEWLENDH